MSSTSIAHSFHELCPNCSFFSWVLLLLYILFMSSAPILHSFHEFCPYFTFFSWVLPYFTFLSWALLLLYNVHLFMISATIVLFFVSSAPSSFISPTVHNPLVNKVTRAGHVTFFWSRQRDKIIEPQGPEKIRKIFWSRCLDGVATTNIVILQ